MEILKNFDKQPEEKTVDYFIRTKVDDLIERSVSEGKKRKQIETTVSNACSNMSTDAGYEYLCSISDFSAFPKYQGRGFQEIAPDISGSLVNEGEATLVLWFTDVPEDEINDFKKKIINSGFTVSGDDFIKTVKKQTFTMSVSASDGKLRIFHMIKDNK